MVSGYQNRRRKAGFIAMSVPHGAGALISNADDLARFTLALHGGRLVSPASYTRMVTPHAASDGEQIRFGYGLVLRNVGGQKLIGHNGGIEGFSADVEYDPAAKSVAVVLQNTQDDAENASRLTLALMARAFGKRVQSPRAVKLAPSQLQALAGVYPAVATSRVIRYQNGLLTEQFNAGAPVALAMASATEAFIPGSDRRLRFTLKNGRAVSVQAYAGGQPDGELAMRAEDIGPSHAVGETEFAQLAGDYQLTDRMDLTISQRDGRFFMQASGQPTLEIFAQSPMRFAAREVLISIEFTRDSAGKVSHLTLYQGDAVVEAPRKQ
jgi:D-alanyl-D-alanine carboxypeptidase